MSSQDSGSPRTPKSVTVNKLPSSLGARRAPSDTLPLTVHTEKEVEGIGMGVLSDGTAFLTGRGLAALCGISSTRLSELSQCWNSQSNNTMAEGVKAILRKNGVLPDKPYVEIGQRAGEAHAYVENVCMAVLEWYTLDQPRKEAVANFRKLAGHALHDMIYKMVGYDPLAAAVQFWRHYRDRVSLNYDAAPEGYFCVFNEIAHLILHLGEQGLRADEKSIPDISVGQCWARHWDTGKLGSKYGASARYPHCYPEYFPQSAANPLDARCYPDAALGEFRRWLREDYIRGGGLIRYLEGQVARRQLPASFPQAALAAFSPQKKVS